MILGRASCEVGKGVSVASLVVVVLSAVVCSSGIPLSEAVRPVEAGGNDPGCRREASIFCCRVTLCPILAQTYTFGGSVMQKGCSHVAASWVCRSHRCHPGILQLLHSLWDSWSLSLHPPIVPCLDFVVSREAETDVLRILVVNLLGFLHLGRRVAGIRVGGQRCPGRLGVPGCPRPLSLSRLFRRKVLYQVGADCAHGWF